jgi:hypothetical protein
MVGETAMTRVARSIMLGGIVAGVLLLAWSSLSASGADRSATTSQDAPLGAYAASGPVDVPDGMWYDATTGLIRGDALQTDAASIAKARGIGLEQATTQLNAEQRMNDIIGEVRAHYPEFVDLIWTDAGVSAQFKSRAPTAALALLGTAGAKLDFELVR